MRPLLALALAAVTTTALSSCTGGGSAEDQPSATASPGASAAEESASAEAAADPVQVLQDAVDATLAVTSFTLDGDLGVQSASDVDVTAQGSVDYETSVADVEVTATTAGTPTTASLLSDGSTLWVGLDGDQVPTLPGGVSWLQGSAEQLVDSPTFSASGLLAPVLVLRGVESADQVEVLGPDEVDGVAVQRYEATVSYDQAVAAAGEDERARLQDTLALGGDPSGVELEVEAAVGEDEVVRDLDVQVLDEAGQAQGSYAMTLSDVGADVPAPEPPPSSEVASGAVVERLLDQLDQLVTP